MKSRRSHPHLLVLAVTVLVVPAAVLACRKEPASKTRATVEGCEGLLASARTSVDKALRIANPVNVKTCEADADCTELQPASCLRLCSGHAVPKTKASAFASAMRPIDEGACKQWRDADCPTISPQPIASCANYVPRCRGGSCTMVAPWE